MDIKKDDNLPVCPHNVLKVLDCAIETIYMTRDFPPKASNASPSRCNQQHVINSYIKICLEVNLKKLNKLQNYLHLTPS